MKIGIYNPYFDSFGGGERYMLTIAEYLSSKNKIDIFWDQNLKKEIKERLALNLDKANFVDNIFARGKSLLEKLNKTSQYNIIFFLSDGSIPSSLAKKNILHFQCPFPYSVDRLAGKFFLNKIKLSRFQATICNSYFTKRYIDQEYGVNSKVVYPPVDTEKFRPSNKENTIISVGRFSKYYINKKQREMMNFFKKNQNNFSNWRLYLIGGLLPQDQLYFDELEKLAWGSPISLFPNELFVNLKEYYGRAKIYWHAAGFEVNEKINPAGLEHFGITTVEAMASGCVPVVFNGGGQKEIVEHGKNGFLWNNERELVDYTKRLISDENLRIKMSQEAIKKGRDFDKERFCREIDKIVKSL